MENDNVTEEISRPTVDDEAYEPTYAEAFPPLPLPGAENGELCTEVQSTPTTAWSGAINKMAVRSTVKTQVFHVPLEERKLSDQQFGDRGRDHTKICSDIMSKTGVAIEISLAKDQSLTVVVTGKTDAVRQARKLVIQQLQTQCSVSVKIPKEHHRFILGLRGSRLNELELSTATKISVPRQDDTTDLITITGTKEGIDRARHEIQVISDEQAKLGFVRLPVPKIYHPFILGPFKQGLKELQERTGARINVPPLSVMKDEITIAGEKDGVLAAEREIRQIYDLKRRTTTTVSVEVKKSQHKYVIGPKGQNLSEILEESGVSVEVPPSESPSETITLRGDADKLGIALTNVYAKANSVAAQDVQVDGWLHRFIIGPKGANIRQITQDFPKVHIDFDMELNKITVEGPPDEVEKVVSQINEQKLDLMSRLAFVDLKVDPKFHRHIIGKNGTNVTRIKNLTGVSIRIPPDNGNSDIIRIEGTPEGVAKAKQELITLVEKMDNERSRDLMIDQRFHKAIIGQAGAKIREIREKFTDVVISFPDSSKQSDVVTLRGPRNEVDRCYIYLQKLSQDMSASSYEEKVKILKEAHPKIIGKGGVQIRKIREETDTKIDLPRENSDSDVITITGRKENVEKAKKMIEAIQKELVNFGDITVDIPHKLHTSMIGSKGHLIREIMDDCNGVVIRFPEEKSASDKVHIRGPKAEVEKAKKRLLDLAADKIESGFTASVRAKSDYHGFLIGRGGASIREFRERTGTRIVFPTPQDKDQELITIIGKKENVERAVKELEDRITELDNKVEQEMRVDPKHHSHFIARRGEILRQIAEDYGGVVVSFPRAASKSDKVVLKGSKDCVELAIKRIQEIVDDLEAQVTIECVVSRKHHGSIMGPKGQRIQDISRMHNVTIKIPERSVEERSESDKAQMINGHLSNGTENGSVNGDGERNGDSDSSSKSPPSQSTSRRDLVLITGRKENCEEAKKAILALVPITVELIVPFDYHGQLIGQKGKEIRQIMDECEVTITIPKPEDHSDVIKIQGPPAKIPHAEEVIKNKIRNLEEERKQRELRNFRLEVEVAAKHHTKLIGRRGAVVNKIRSDHDVQIIFPDKDKDKERPDIITIVGLEEKAKNARDDILQKVQELEDMYTEDIRIDPRVHSRLIGARGRAISKMMEEFHVNIRMPGRDAEDPDLVVVSGNLEEVKDCIDELRNLEEEYLQDAIENDVTTQYTLPSDTRAQNSSQGSSGVVSNQPSRGFVVRDAPWSQSYMNSTEDFPNLGVPVEATSSVSARPVWPIVKR